jgi:hypothetical protein
MPHRFDRYPPERIKDIFKDWHASAQAKSVF